MPSTLALLGDRRSGGLTALISTIGDGEGADPIMTLPQTWANSCVGAAAPQQTLRHAELTGGEQAEGPRAPDAAQAVHGDGTDRVVDPEVLDEVDAEHDDDPATAPMMIAPVAFTQ